MGIEAQWRCCGWVLLLVLLAVPGRGFADRMSSEQFHYATGPEPTWVTAVALPPSPAADPAQSAAIGYLLVEKQLRVEGGEETEYRRMALTPLRQDGLSEAAQHEITFNPEYQTLTIHRVVVRRGDRVIDKRDAARIRLIQRESEMEQSLYVGTVSALIVLDDVRVGDVVEFSYSVHGRNPVFGERHFSSHTLSWSVPVARVVRRVLIEAQRKLQVRTYNGAPQPRVRVVDGQREYLWDLQHVEPYINEGQNPQWYLPQAWVQLSEYRSWDGVRDWAAELYRWNGRLNPQLQAMVQRWRALADRRQAVRQALGFVQRDIRYFGIEMGQSSHRPNDPNTVFARRYGDCKDKAQLLIVLLQALGLDARPALVSSAYNRAIGDWLPSPGVFDHVIVLATLNGERYWLDGTRNFQEGDLAAVSTPEYGVALVAADGAVALQDMHNPVPQRALVDVEEKFVVSRYDQPVAFEVQSVYRGAEAEYQRQRLARDNRDGLARRYLNYYARRYPGIELEAPPQVAIDEAHSEVRVREQYRIPNFWEREDGKLYFSLCGDTIQPYTALPDTVRRHTPLALRYPIRVRHVSVLGLPDVDQFDVGKEPAMSVADNAIDYRQHVTYRARQLRIEHDYRSKTDAVGVDASAEYIARLRRINGSLCFLGWLADPAQRPVRGPSSNPLEVLSEAIQGRAH